MAVELNEKEIRGLLETLAGELAERYIADVLLPNLARVLNLHVSDKEAVLETLEDPEKAFRAFLMAYSARKTFGADPELLSKAFGSALESVAARGSFEAYLRRGDENEIYLAFQELWVAQKQKAPERFQPLLMGCARLVFEIFHQDGVGNVFGWVRDQVRFSHHIEPIFYRLKEIKTFGPKLSSVFLRDCVLLYDLERRIVPPERFHAQPVNTVVRYLAPYFVPEARNAKLADWVLAGKVSKYTRLMGISGTRFNAGCSYLAARIVPELGGVTQAVRHIVKSLAA